MKDITGQRFGRLTALQPVKRDQRVRWRCLCDCGKEIEVRSAGHLTSGNTKSCGCLHRDVARRRHLLHGGKGTRMYNIWKNARQRCRNPKNPDFYLYGARGVQFETVWDDFAVFREWSLAHGYRDDLTLDRIDPDGNYGPDNCRWVDWVTQANNRRPRKVVMP